MNVPTLILVSLVVMGIILVEYSAYPVYTHVQHVLVVLSVLHVLVKEIDFPYLHVSVSLLYMIMENPV